MTTIRYIFCIDKWNGHIHGSSHFVLHGQIIKIEEDFLKRKEFEEGKLEEIKSCLQMYILIKFELNILRDNIYIYVLNIYHGYIDQFQSLQFTLTS